MALGVLVRNAVPSDNMLAILVFMNDVAGKESGCFQFIQSLSETSSLSKEIFKLARGAT